MMEPCPYKGLAKQGENPWKCERCQYQNGDAPPQSLACLRCKQVAQFMAQTEPELKKLRHADLIEHLYNIVGCEYLSDLKSSTFRKQIIQAIQTIAFGEYSLEDWSEATSYLFGVEIKISSEENLKMTLKEYD